MKKRALLSVYNKTPEFDRLVIALLAAGYELIASGGTYRHIKEQLRFGVTDVSDITKVKPVLGHRVVTLAEEIHGGLLADERLHMKELDELGWPFIDVAVCTFYPLEDTIRKMEEKYAGLTNPADLQAKWAEINDMVDIGGPTLIRSACKGGRIVLAKEDCFANLIDQLESGKEISFRDRLLFHADAIDTVSDYLKVESRFRGDRFEAEEI